jgi:multicomponent Na+:H+ antiporter subunit A
MRIRFSPVLATGARTMVPTLTLFSVFLLIVGHDLPGGGFAGGLLVSAALLMVFFAFGARGLRRAMPVDPEILTGVGLGLAIVGGIVGWIFADAFLAYASTAISLPIVGSVKVTSLLLFDLGVYVLVVGLVVTAVTRLGQEYS